MHDFPIERHPSYPEVPYRELIADGAWPAEPPTLRLKTREIVQPTGWIARHNAAQPVAGGVQARWSNRLIGGDNLPVMAALLAGDAQVPSLRGHIHLIYSGLPAGEVSGSGSRLVSRLILMRELLAPAGTLVLRVDAVAAQAVRYLLNDVLGVGCWVDTVACDTVLRFCKCPVAAARWRESLQPLPPHPHPTHAAHWLACLLAHTTQANDWVADFYAHTGTTAVLAEKLGRRWMAVDRDEAACMRIRRRLCAHKVSPFVWQTL